MKTLIKIALGFLLLVSAAAATGNNNCVYTDVYQSASGNCITGGVNLAQITDASSFVLGNYNYVDQCLEIEANCNSLTASMDTMNVAQRVDMVANATGCDNGLFQGADISLKDNCATDSNITQWAIQGADAIGSCNEINQWTESKIKDNCLTMGNMMQLSDFGVCATGNDNCIDQGLYQCASDNSLTGSSLWQQAAKVANVLGCYNVVDQGCNFQSAEYNCLTGSMLNQIICENAQITGNCNFAGQYADTSAFCNSLVNAGMLQSINEEAIMEGCDNEIYQNVCLNTDENCMTGGMLTQSSVISSND
ncbi:MAG: hypothetical protein ACE14P_14440 [Methanotrichaceae archaeon]